MKIHKHLLAVIAVAGLGYAGLVSAVDFSVYGSLRGGLNQSEAGAVTETTNTVPASTAATPALVHSTSL